MPTGPEPPDRRGAPFKPPAGQGAASPPAERSTFDSMLRGLRIGGQGVAEGIGNIIGAPGDFADMLGEALRASGRHATDFVFGDEAGQRLRQTMSETAAGRTASALGGAVDYLLPDSGEIKRGFGNDLRAIGLGDVIIPESEMTPWERAGKSINEFGTTAAIGSAGAVRAAGSRLGATAPGKRILKREHKALRKGDAGGKFSRETTLGAGVGFGKEAAKDPEALGVEPPPPALEPWLKTLAGIEFGGRHLPAAAAPLPPGDPFGQAVLRAAAAPAPGGASPSSARLLRRLEELNRRGAHVARLRTASR